MILDRGVFEGIRNGDFAILYKREARESLPGEYKLVAEIEAIKVGDKSSHWVIINDSGMKSVREGEIYAMAKMSNRGRRSYVHNVVLVNPEERKKALFRAKEEYASLPVTVKEVFSPTKERTIRQGQWVQVEREPVEVYGIAENVRMPASVAEMDKEEERKEFKDMVKESVDDINSFDGDLALVYANTWGESGKLARDRYIQGLKKREQLTAQSELEKLANSDHRWSKNMSDQELKDFFIKRGIAKEVHRQKEALYEWEGNEVTAIYGTRIIKNNNKTLVSDLELALGYELHLASVVDFATFAKNLSVELSMAFGTSHLPVKEENILSNEHSFRGFLHWYFHNNPLVIQDYLFYGGIGFLRGESKVDHDDNGSINNSKYQVTSFPVWRLGFKYRFLDKSSRIMNVGVGFSALLTLNTATYKALRVKRLPVWIKKKMATISIGLNLYF